MVESITVKAVPETNRPYAPPSNITDVLKRLRSRNVPERVGIEFLRDVGISEGTLSRAFFAFRFLGLVDDDGIPTATLRSMGVSTDEEYRSALAAIIRDKYADVFAVLDPAQDSQDRFVDYFRRYTPGSQRDRMVIFFLGMCREAGIPTLDAPRQRSSQVSSSGSTRKRNISSAKLSKGTNSSNSRPLFPTPDSQLPPALELLVRSLPPLGKPFPETRREQWLSMAKATLDFAYGETSLEVSDDDGDGDSEEDK